MTRSEHLQWAKDRALQYLEANDLDNAFASFISDLKKHPDLQRHMAIEAGMVHLIADQLNSVSRMRDFINGTN